jgi:hypothetical protein
MLLKSAFQGDFVIPFRMWDDEDDEYDEFSSAV